MSTDPDVKRLEAPPTKTPDLEGVFGTDLFSEIAEQMRIRPSEAGFMAMTEAHIDDLIRLLTSRNGEFTTTLRSTEAGKRCLYRVKGKLINALALIDLSEDEIRNAVELLQIRSGSNALASSPINSV